MPERLPEIVRKSIAARPPRKALKHCMYCRRHLNYRNKDSVCAKCRDLFGTGARG